MSSNANPMEARPPALPPIWTIGHSNRTGDQFLELLEHNQIAILADVRHFPGSRRVRQFNKQQLAKLCRPWAFATSTSSSSEGAGRHGPTRTTWHGATSSFRGYADYMETEPYRTGIQRLVNLAREGRTAIMCSEAVWWHCHRSLIADDLKSRGGQVLHILSLHSVREHPYTSAAQLVGGRLSYQSLLPPEE